LILSRCKGNLTVLRRQTKHTTKSIRILQINTQGSNYKTYTILNKTAGKYNLLLIQEPWIGNISGGNRGPPAHKAWTLYIPTQSIRQGDHPHVIRSDIKITMHSNIATDPDFQILKISQKPYASIIIFNIYNAKDANNIHTLV
jgi:hypothetical protein